MTKTAKDKPVKFEEAIAQLEGIIEHIESGQAGLEESLTEYEKGMRLIAQCRGVLDAAEKKIAELAVDARGNLKVAPAAADEGETEEEIP